MSKKVYRPGMEPLPLRMRSRPVWKGYPVPWFVAEPPKGEDWDLRIADVRKHPIALREHRCWICGEKMPGSYRAFVIGPMCAVNCTTGEPPCHADCAHWAAKVCPFLNQTQQRRREGDMPAVLPMPGEPILRQAGVSLVWLTRTFTLFGDGRGGVLINIGPPDRTDWYTHGRKATRAEILASIESGLPALQAMAEAEGNGAVEALAAKVEEAMCYLPQELAA